MCMCLTVCVCGCVCPNHHIPPLRSVYKSKSSSLRTCLHAIHNITHSLSFLNYPHHQRHESWHNSMMEKESPVSSPSHPSPPFLLFSIVPSPMLAFSTASWNVSMRRVRSQGCFLCKKNEPFT